MKKFIPVFTLLVFLFCKEVVLSQSKGFDSNRLDRITSFLQDYVDRLEMNGAVAMVSFKGQVMYQKAVGWSDIEKKTPMSQDHIFRIASMTKPIVSVALMTLYEEGKFSLDDPVSKFIPAFANPKVIIAYNAADTTYITEPAKNEITIRHLLSHTSGIGYAQIGTDMANAIYQKNNISAGLGTPFDKLSTMIPKLAKLPLYHHPGEKYLYGLNTDVLGYLIEVISGKPLDQFLKERIFVPLGMLDTYFYLPEEKHTRLVPMHGQDENGKLFKHKQLVDQNGRVQPDFPAVKGTYFSGGAGLSSTATDYTRFCQMLVSGGKLGDARILSPHTLRLMTMNQIGDLSLMGNPDNPNKFGLGFGLYTQESSKRQPIGEGSFDWAGAFATHFWVDPVNELTVVVMRNVWPTRQWDLGDRIKPVVYQALW